MPLEKEVLLHVGVTMSDQMLQRLGEYHLIRVVGSGAFSNVYLGEHRFEQRVVAIKVLKTQLTADVFNDFLSEARMFRLKHPHILQLLDFGIEGNVPFLVMEYAPGGTLRQRYPKGTRVPLDLVCSYVNQVASALQYAHTMRIVHRDVKPQNMLLDANGHVLLSDFGISVIAHSEHSFIPQNTAGTLPYMAPEQIRGKPQPASDQYALGVTVYEWLCGIRPFQGSPWEIMTQHLTATVPSLKETAPTLSVAVDEVVRKALTKDPGDRFTDMLAFARTLEQASRDHDDTTALIEGNILAPEAKRNLQDFAVIAHQEHNPSSWPPLSSLENRDEEASIQPSLDDKGNRHLDAGRASVVRIPTLHLNTPGEVSALSSQSRKAGPFQPQHHAPWRELSKKRLALFIGLIVLIAGSGTLFLVSKGNMQKHTIATVSIEAAPQLTAIAAARAYARGTAAHGVQFGFDPAHTGNNPYEKQLSPLNISRLSLLWYYEPVDQPSGSAESPPTVANGLVYMASGRFYAFDAACRANCQPLWSYQGIGGDTFGFAPAIVNGLVYEGSENGRLYVFNATCRAKCLPLWSYQTDGAFDSPPTVANGLVFVRTSAGRFYAFDATCRADCLPLWSYQIDGAFGSSPAVANGLVYVGSSDGRLYAFNATCRAKCLPLWSYLVSGITASSPAVANGLVYVEADGYALFAFDARCRANCQPLWFYSTFINTSLLTSVLSAPAVANGLVYIGPNDGRFYAFDATCRAKCLPLWSYPISDSTLSDSSSPIIANGLVYVGSNDGRLYVFNATCRAKCLPLWSYLIQGGMVWPTVADGTLYVASATSISFYAFGIPS